MSSSPAVVPDPSLVLPPWAAVSEARRAHIVRVTGLLDRWAAAMGVDAAEARDWHDAGRLHDALRDAPEAALRDLVPELGDLPSYALHGPAAAARLAAEGESRVDVLEAVRWHTLGSADWGRVGRALFLADFLEPGRKFAREERAALAARVPEDFDGAFRQVVQWRLERTIRHGEPLLPRTVALWNAVR